MGEIVLPQDRKEIRDRARALIQSGDAPGMRLPLHSAIEHIGQRVVARAQVLYLAASQVSHSATPEPGREVTISYTEALACASEGSLRQPPVGRKGN